MGQKQSKSRAYSRYLLPLPEFYEKNQISEVYSLKNQNHTCVQSTNPHIPNPESILQKQQYEQQQVSSARSNESQKLSQHEGYPTHLRHYFIILNDFQTKEYLNHLVYRNQPEFKDFIIQVPYGEIEKHQKYTKIHLYAQEVALTLNQVSNLPFHDMCMILYTSLIAYKYLYSYFGFFKIEQNMIGFNQQAKTKVWINHKITKDKPLPIVTDINLKRNKQEENYMVDDLLTIFWNKVDRETIPKNFNLVSKFMSMRNSRHTPSRLSLSRIQNQAQLSQSMVNCLQNNLTQDFSEGSFDKCLEYLQDFLNIQRPQFLKFDLKRTPDSKISSSSPSVQTSLNTNLQKSIPYRNFVPSIHHVLKNTSQPIRQLSDSRCLTASNVNINFKQLGISGSRPQSILKSSSRYDNVLQQNSLNPKIVTKMINSFDGSINNLPTVMEQSVCNTMSLQSSMQIPNQSPNRSPKISMRVINSPQPMVNSSVSNSDTMRYSYFLSSQQPNVQNSGQSPSMNHSLTYPVMLESKNPSVSFVRNGPNLQPNMETRLVRPSQVQRTEISLKRTQSINVNGPKRSVRFSEHQDILDSKVLNDKIIEV